MNSLTGKLDTQPKDSFIGTNHDHGLHEDFQAQLVSTGVETR